MRNIYKLGNKVINYKNPTYIIAEVGVNHNGDINIAKKLIREAKLAGADCIKFQTFSSSKLVSKTATKAKYQKLTTNSKESQYTMLKKLELDKDDHIDEITGSAYYKSGDCCGYLTVQLKDTPEAPYWVLELGPIVNNYYDYAIVSDDKALSLFVLARDVDNFYKYYDEQVLQSLNDFGFTKKYNMPKTMNQTDCLLN